MIYCRLQSHPGLILDLFGTDEISPGSFVEIPGNARLIYLTDGGATGKLIDASPLLEFALAFGSGLSSSLVASWLYNKLKGRALDLYISDEKIYIDLNEIRFAIERRTISLRGDAQRWSTTASPSQDD